MDLKEEKTQRIYLIEKHLFYDALGDLYTWVDVTPWWRKILNFFMIFGIEITEEPIKEKV